MAADIQVLQQSDEDTRQTNRETETHTQTETKTERGIVGLVAATTLQVYHLIITSVSD